MSLANGKTLKKYRYDVIYKGNYYKKSKNGDWLIYGNESLYPVKCESVIESLNFIYNEEKENKNETRRY